jgi:hypothetical protein
MERISDYFIMKIQFKYYLTDGIDIEPLSDEKMFECVVKTFSDSHALFSKHIMTTYSDYYHVVIKSIKIVDIP